MLKKRIWHSFVPSIIWLLIIAVGSFIPSSNVPKVDVPDKWVHFVFYAIFSFLFYIPVSTYTKRIKLNVQVWLIVLVVSTIIGLTVELVQHYFISGRCGEGLDILANTFGVISALIVSQSLKHNGVL